MHAILDKWIANGLIRPSDKPPTEENKKKKKRKVQQYVHHPTIDAEPCRGYFTPRQGTRLWNW
jgi:hypothetical protein